MELTTLILIGVVNLVVVSLFAMSGGIGLIVRPILLLFGIPPDFMIGTLRASAVPGDFTSLAVLWKEKKIDWKLAFLYAIPDLLGGLVGFLLIQHISNDILGRIIGALLLVSGIIFFLNKELGVKPKKIRRNKRFFYFSMPLMFLVGFLMLIVGGMGIISRYIFMAGHGKTAIEATATHRVVAIPLSFTVAVLFIAFALVDWHLFMVLLLTSVVGQYFGTKLVLKKGEHFLRILLLIVVFASGIKLLFF